MNVSTHRTRVFVRHKNSNKILVMIRVYDSAVARNRVMLLPGGGVDPGESSLTSMRREVQEELGVSLSNVSMFYQHHGTRPIEPPERKYWPNAKTVTNHFDFYTALIPSQVMPRLKEPDKFERIDWIETSEIVAYANAHKATISDGILDAAQLLSNFKQTTSAKWQ